MVVVLLVIRRAFRPERFLLKQGAKILDVLHCMLQNAHLAHLFDGCCRGDVPLQCIEPHVDRLHPVPLPRVPLDRLQVLLRLDHVPVDWMDRHQLASGSHHEGFIRVS